MLAASCVLVTSTNPRDIAPGPTPTKKDSQTLGSIAALVVAVVFVLVGVVLVTFGIAPAFVLVVIGVGIGVGSRRTAKRVDPS